MSLREVQNLFHHLCLDKKFVFNRETLAKYASEDTVDFLLDQPIQKQTVYRELVENNISSMIFTALPLTFHFLDTRQKNTLIRDFISEYQARSNHYRHIPYDFFEYARRKDIFAKLKPNFLAELCDYEFASYELLFRDHRFPIPASASDKELSEARVVLNPNLVLKEYAFPVNHITEKSAPQNLKKQKTDLIIYRRVDNFHQNSFVLNDLTCSLIEILLKCPDKNFETCLQLLLEQNLSFQKEAVAEEAVAFLKELLDKQIVLALV